MDNIKSGRIEWIDAMRGFAIIVIVFNHIEHFGFGYCNEVGSLRNLLTLVQLPIFYFISGYLALQPSQLITKDCRRFVQQKVYALFIPTIIFGCLFSVTVYASIRGYANPLRGICSMIIDSAKNGYWFTIVLLEMFIVYYVASYYCANSKRQTSKVLLLIAVLFWAVSYPCTNDHIVNNGAIRLDAPNLVQAAINCLSLNRLFYYFQWFVFGNIFARNKETLFEKIKDGKTPAIILVSFVCLYLVYNTIDNVYIYNVLKVVLGYLGLLIIVSFFYTYQDSFKSDSFIGKSLQYVGKRTLDVYLIHFYFIPSLPCIGAWFIENPNVVIELAFVTILSILVVITCLIISNILRISPLLSHYLFGVKKQ